MSEFTAPHHAAVAQLTGPGAPFEVIDSPRGSFHFSKAHNPIQNIYLRKVENGENVVVKTAAANLNDPARGCRL